MPQLILQYVNIAKIASCQFAYTSNVMSLVLEDLEGCSGSSIFSRTHIVYGEFRLIVNGEIRPAGSESCKEMANLAACT